MTHLKNHIFNVIYLAWRFLSSCSCTYPDKILIDMLATLMLAGSDIVKGYWDAQGILNPHNVFHKFAFDNLSGLFETVLWSSIFI